MVAPVISMFSNKHHGMSGMVTQLFTQHSGQCPLRGGYAVSLTNWANTPIANGGPPASWPSFVDPIARVRQIAWPNSAWTQGNANPLAVGLECAGYAEFSKEDWVTPEGLKQLENLAHEWVYYWNLEAATGNEIPLRWLETWEVNAVMAGNRDIKGFCTHGQIEPGSRWDPGPNFPYTQLMNRIKELLHPKTEELFTMDQYENLMAKLHKINGVANRAVAIATENQRRINALPTSILDATYPLEGSEKGKDSTVRNRFAWLPHEQRKVETDLREVKEQLANVLELLNTPAATVEFVKEG